MRDADKLEKIIKIGCMLVIDVSKRVEVMWEHTNKSWPKSHIYAEMETWECCMWVKELKSCANMLVKSEPKRQVR